MIKQRKIELLAPAKNLECGIEAINHGADAVYIGAPKFGARAAAVNSLEDIEALVQHAHLYNARIYVTVNTILKEEELKETEEMIHALYRIGVDALIVQDMGITKLNLPPIPLHASTQMDNRTPEKVKFLWEAGFRQVVLARELSLREIKKIYESCPEVPLEVFVHGALCVSYSGQCYVSQACFGRSANRGECAQFCRLPFSLVDADGKVIVKDKHLLSLKDMNQNDELEQLLDAGASSFKIEGRLKDVSYVKNVTAAYRQKLDAIFARRPEYVRASSGTCSFEFKPQLDKSFSRGFTHYFLNGRDKEIFSFDTPKSLGEEMGTMKEARGNYLTVAGLKSFNNGDGVCYIDEQGRLQGRYMNALLAAQEQCGWLPSWSAPGETGGMLGNHSISLLADAWAKGIRTFDPEKALKAYAHEAMNKGPWGGANGRGFWKEYFELGYVPYPESMGSSAQTMEYAYDDFCGYQLAKMTGNKHYQEVFARQMYNYKNVFDPSIGFMRGKGVDGKWQEPFDPLEWGGPFCEGNAWHYTWSVFHDVEGLIDLFGSDQRFTTKMDSVFALPSTIKPGTYGGVIHEMKEMELAGMGQYAHGNQPIQHMPYLYSYAGQPWKTQYWVRQIVERLYNSTERGYPGDEDQGGMSSWYILSSLGIYAVCPGTDEYVIGSPLFKKATITMENGNKFVIEANNNSKENLYIQSATLNGRVLDKNFIRYDDIADGGIIRFEMGSQPNKERCTSKYAAPFSLSKE